MRKGLYQCAQPDLLYTGDMDLTILQLAPDEWPRYRQLRLEALQDSPQAFVTTYSDMLTRPASFWQERLSRAAEGQTTWLLFAQADERLVGMIGAYLPTDEDTPEVVSVYVSPEYRGRGVSGALMEAILATLRQKGFRQARLTVNRCQTAALGLYRRFGFQIVGEREETAGDGLLHPGYIMVKDL